MQIQNFIKFVPISFTNKNIQFSLDKLPSYTKKSVHANLVIGSSLHFIQCICRSNLPISPPSKQSYITVIETSLQKNVETLQEAASEALGSLSSRFDISNSLPKWLGNLQGKASFNVRRGWATAFGYVRLSRYNDILEVLCNVIENDLDVEVKRNSVKSMGLIFSRITTFQGIIHWDRTDEILCWHREYGQSLQIVWMIILSTQGEM